MASPIAITCSTPTVSACMPADSRALDVDVSIRVGRTTYEGEVTLLPADSDGRYRSWGDLSNWISSPLLDAIRDLHQRDEVIRELQAAAGEACDRQARVTDWPAVAPAEEE